MTAALHVQHLSKTYGSGDLAVHAVDTVDLDVNVGEVVLVMGPSGSGKTTLLLMLGAMLRPTSGSIEVDGQDLATAPERSLPPAPCRALRVHLPGLQPAGGARRRRERPARRQPRWPHRKLVSALRT